KDDEDATMFPSSGMCESKKRDLDPGDLAGLEHLYVDTTSPLTKSGLASMGCSLAGKSDNQIGSDAFVALLVAGLLVGRRRAARAALFVAAALVALPSLGRATTLRQLSLDDMSADAVVVARGVIGQVAPHRFGGHIYTDATLVVSECLKGRCDAT